MDEKMLGTLASLISEKILKKNRVIQPDEPLLSSGIIDSFSLVDLSLLIEDHFGVIIDDSELNASTFDTLADLANLIEQRRS
jgi:acyl carrier protein